MPAINDIFKQLDGDKRDKILNAAYKEFAEHGYEKASTNAIVKNAGISKGTLFNYFNSKNELYQDLVDLGIKMLLDKYLSHIDEIQTDFIDKLRQMSVMKMRALNENPYAFEFFAGMYLKDNYARISAEALNKITEMVDKFRVDVFNDADYSKFRTDIPKQMAIQMIQWCVDGYTEALSAKFKNMPEPPINDMTNAAYWDEFYEFLDVLKTVFYKA